MAGFVYRIFVFSYFLLEHVAVLIAAQIRRDLSSFGLQGLLGRGTL